MAEPKIFIVLDPSSSVPVGTSISIQCFSSVPGPITLRADGVVADKLLCSFEAISDTITVFTTKPLTLDYNGIPLSCSVAEFFSKTVTLFVESPATTPGTYAIQQ